MIKLGYELVTGKPVSIDPSHMIVTGLTQYAGKTTTLESALKNSGMKSIVFKTKIGEESFMDGHVIRPFFKHRTDWQYVISLIEAITGHRVASFERYKIVHLCQIAGKTDLYNLYDTAKRRMNESKSNTEKDILRMLLAYFDIVLPKLKQINFATSLELQDGINIVDLEKFGADVEIQSLIISSILDEVLNREKNTIVVIPEAWKFIPEKKGSPCKDSVNSYIRQGASKKNFLWIDSQEMASVDKSPLKQISQWVLGYQSERNEVKHTLDQIPLPKKKKPVESDIMSLGKGIFILANRVETTKLYVQPFWMDDNTAIAIATGRLRLEDVQKPKTNKITKFETIVESKNMRDSLGSRKIETQIEKTELVTEQFKIKQDNSPFESECHGFNKPSQPRLTDPEEGFDSQLECVVCKEPLTNHSKTGFGESCPKKKFYEMIDDKFARQDEKLNIVMEKILELHMKQSQYTHLLKTKEIIKQEPFDLRKLITEIKSEIMAQIPQQGTVVFQVNPLQKLQKDFLNEALEAIKTKVSTLDPELKRMLKYVESRQVGIKTSELVEKCFMQKVGGANKKIKEYGDRLVSEELIKFDKSHQTYYPILKEHIEGFVNIHNGSDNDVENLYQHILMVLL